jgi:hypothetical protein
MIALLLQAHHSLAAKQIMGEELLAQVNKQLGKL